MSNDDLMTLRPGDVTPMTTCTILHGDPKAEHLKLSYKALKGRRFVFMFLGMESLDGTTAPLDIVQRLYDMGWSHPELKPGGVETSND